MQNGLKSKQSHLAMHTLAPAMHTTHSTCIHARTCALVHYSPNCNSSHHQVKLTRKDSRQSQKQTSKEASPSMLSRTLLLTSAALVTRSFAFSRDLKSTRLHSSH